MMADTWYMKVLEIMHVGFIFTSRNNKPRASDVNLYVGSKTPGVHTKLVLITERSYLLHFCCYKMKDLLKTCEEIIIIIVVVVTAAAVGKCRCL